MLTFADVVHLLPHKFACLRAGTFAFPCIFPGTFDGLFLRHMFPPYKKASSHFVFYPIKHML